MLKLVGMVQNAYLSYLAHVNIFLSLACRHVEIGRYGQKRLLIILVDMLKLEGMVRNAY